MSKQDPLQALLVRPGPWVLGDLLAPLALSGLEALPMYPAPSALRDLPVKQVPLVLKDLLVE